MSEATNQTESRSNPITPTTPTHAIVEIMGHDRIAGKIGEQSLAGVALLAVDVPAIPSLPELVKPYGYREYVVPAFVGREGFRKLFGGPAIFSIRYCSEIEALADEVRRLERDAGFYRDMPAAQIEALKDLKERDGDDEEEDLADPFVE